MIVATFLREYYRGQKITKMLKKQLLFSLSNILGFLMARISKINLLALQMFDVYAIWGLVPLYRPRIRFRVRLGSGLVSLLSMVMRLISSPQCLLLVTKWQLHVFHKLLICQEASNFSKSHTPPPHCLWPAPKVFFGEWGLNREGSCFES